MSKCVHSGCNGIGFPGAKCDSCASVWCKNGSCHGSHNKKEKAKLKVQLAKAAVKVKSYIR
ncbi:hypothetical protein N9854_05985 [Amylibacter sp.]|nr:hypothetical protein [Amylibacter sp.]